MSEAMMRQFVFSGLLLQDSLDTLEKEGISVRKSGDLAPVSRVVEADFSPRIWHDANNMASVYQAIFCIENTIRSFIVERMSERYGLNWWEGKSKRQDKESCQNAKGRRTEKQIFLQPFGQRNWIYNDGKPRPNHYR